MTKENSYMQKLEELSSLILRGFEHHLKGFSIKKNLTGNPSWSKKKAIPDIVLKKGNKILLLMDAKYKLRYKSLDWHQAGNYVRIIRDSNCVLIYPKNEIYSSYDIDDIDSEFYYKNNDKKNLILLCQKHHYRAERLICLKCGANLVEIIEGITINDQDIAKLEDIYAYSCRKHVDFSLRVYDKRKLIISSLYAIVQEKLKEKELVF